MLIVVFLMFSLSHFKRQCQNAFNDLNSIVITESVAKKYFGDKNPIGKTLAGKDWRHVVTGVIKDIPSNSHFHFDFLISIKKFGGDKDNEWGWYNFYTYVKVKPNTNISTLEKNSGYL